MRDVDFKTLMEEASKKEKMDDPARLSSRLDHPATIPYNSQSIIVPPRGTVTIANLTLLGTAPAGIYIKPLRERPNKKKKKKK
jgi:hypothetical protein